MEYVVDLRDYASDVIARFFSELEGKSSIAWYGGARPTTHTMSPYYGFIGCENGYLVMSDGKGSAKLFNRAGFIEKMAELHPKKKEVKKESPYKTGQKVKLLYSDYWLGFNSWQDVVKNCYGVVRVVFSDTSVGLEIHRKSDGGIVCGGTNWCFMTEFIAPWPDEKQDIRDYCKEHRVWAAKDEDGRIVIFRKDYKPEISNSPFGHYWGSKLGNCGVLSDNEIIIPSTPWDKSLVAPDGSMPLLEKKEPERATHFEVGKWYVNVGENEGCMLDQFPQKEVLLDGKPHKCISTCCDGGEFTGLSGKWIWHPCDWIEVPEPSAEKYVPKKDDPIFAWDKGFDKRCPCPVHYVHHVDENNRVWDYMDGQYCEEGIDYDYYRKYDPALVGVPMRDWR